MDKKKTPLPAEKNKRNKPVRRNLIISPFLEGVSPEYRCSEAGLPNMPNVQPEMKRLIRKSGILGSL